MSKTAQEVHNKIGDFIEQLAACGTAIEHIRNEYCDRIVERNAALAHITFGSDKRDEISKVIVEGAAYEGYLRKQLGRLDIDIFTVKEHLEITLADFREVWNARNEEFGDVKARLEQEKSRLTERLREHAINSPNVRDKVWEITDGKCVYCEIELTRERDPREPHRCFEVDHIVAKANGGPDHLSNYVPACAACNGSKSDRSIFGFLVKRQALPGLKVVGGTDQ